MRHQRPFTDRLDVLIVEDDPDVRAFVRAVLEAAGYSCAEAGDGREALAVAGASPPRLALRDLMMPELDGLATARRLQAAAGARPIRLYCLTARDDPSAR